MLADNLIENIPYHRLLTFNHLASLLDGCGMTLLLKLVVNKWLEQLQRHLLWQSTLMQLQLRTDNDH